MSYWYEFKEEVKYELGDRSITSYVTPHSDEYQYEHPFNYQFDSPEEAQDFVEEYFYDWQQESLPVNWVLVKISMEVVRPLKATEELPDDV